MASLLLDYFKGFVKKMASLLLFSTFSLESMF